MMLGAIAFRRAPRLPHSTHWTMTRFSLQRFAAGRHYSAFSDEDKVRLFNVFGGIPYYNRLISVKKSVRENIIDLIASPGARLENEVSMYLNSEISKITNANEVFEALAKGFSKYKEMAPNFCTFATMSI